MARVETAFAWFEKSGGLMLRFHKLLHEKINLVFRGKTHRRSVRRHLECFSSDFFLPPQFLVVEAVLWPWGSWERWLCRCPADTLSAPGCAVPLPAPLRALPPLALHCSQRKCSPLCGTVVWGQREEKHRDNQNNAQIRAGWSVWWRSAALGKGRTGLQHYQPQLCLSNN